MAVPSKVLSVIVPAYNEEKNVGETCLGIVRLAQKHGIDYEILVYDDCSTDGTSDVVKLLQADNPNIRLFRHETNRGLGYNYRTGIQAAQSRYAIMVPGDNEVEGASLDQVFSQIGKADILICYSSNPEVRSWIRRFISNLFTSSLNFLFGLKVKYYNGTCVIRTDLAKRHLPKTSSFAYMAVLLVRLLKSGYSYEHLTFALKKREFGSTKAFQPKNVINVICDVLTLFWRIQILRKDFDQVRVEAGDVEGKEAEVTTKKETSQIG